ncbi:MAG: hypothetical protein EON92_07115 [Burkholderiales bacterium]|nr:MAG: hypothetical protein EON92_07115 [Burkholderiales bacterium]
MYCPTCTTTPLVQSLRQQVEIDYCPHCRGVWLDRGELEKILERAGRTAPEGPAWRAEARSDHGRNRTDGRRMRHRKSWLSDILD